MGLSRSSFFLFGKNRDQDRYHRVNCHDQVHLSTQLIGRVISSVRKNVMTAAIAGIALNALMDPLRLMSSSLFLLRIVLRKTLLSVVLFLSHEISNQQSDAYRNGKDCQQQVDQSPTSARRCLRCFSFRNHFGHRQRTVDIIDCVVVRRIPDGTMAKLPAPEAVV